MQTVILTVSNPLIENTVATQDGNQYNILYICMYIYINSPTMYRHLVAKVKIFEDVNNRIIWLVRMELIIIVTFSIFKCLGILWALC